VANLIPLRRGEAIFDGRGVGTRRFIEYVEQLTSVTNENTTVVESVSGVSEQANLIAANVSQLSQQIKDMQSEGQAVDLSMIESRLTALENSIQTVIDLSQINQKLDAIEAQL